MSVGDVVMAYIISNKLPKRKKPIPCCAAYAVIMNQRMVLIGRRIRQIREARQLSQEKLSQMCGGDPSPKTISNLETANLKRSTTVETLDRVASALGVELWELFMSDDRMASLAHAYERASTADRDTLLHVADLASRYKAG